MALLMLFLLVVCGLVALTNWRQAIFLTIILDAVRDLIRKIAPGQPVWMSQAIVIIWAIIFFSCLSQNLRVLREVRRIFPRLRKGTISFFAALVPGAFLSVLLYRNGWILAGLGGLSYVGPLLGMFIGICFAKRSRDVFQLMQIYVVVNSLVLIGSPAEQLGLGWPGLGGLIGHEWIRHMPGVLVRMVSGFFRSPDIAGFHAAHVVVFSILLAVPRARGKSVKLHWLLTGLFGAFALFLAGRRKMFAIPFVFLVFWVLTDVLRKQRGSKNLLVFVGAVLLFVVGGTMYLARSDEELEHHQIYLSTTIYDAVPSLYAHAFQDSVVTVAQSGVLGSGLGIVTQGAQYAGIDRGKAWQEDGISRLFKELGVVGVLLLLFAAFHFIAESRRALRMPLQDSTRVLLQNSGLAIAVANLACFVSSHQHISGDVANGVLPLLFLGGVFGHVLGDRASNAARMPASRPGLQGSPVIPSDESIAAAFSASLRGE